MAGHQKKHEPLGVINYANNSYAKHINDHKFIIEYYFCLKETIITWYSK